MAFLFHNDQYFSLLYVTLDLTQWVELPHKEQKLFLILMLNTAQN